MDSNINISIETLFRAYYGQLCMYCVHYVHDISVAEDIVMDCFLRLDEALNDGKDIVSLKSYIFKMCRNKSIDIMQRGDIFNESDDIPDLVDEDDDLIEQCAREARLWNALDSLPPACRNVFLMSKRDGMKNKDISIALGISIKTVEAQITKAYKILRGKANDIYNFLFF